MTASKVKRPQRVEYIAVGKVGREYALAFHTSAGVSPVPGLFKGEQVDQIRAHERKLRGKKLTDAEWEEFFHGIE